MLRFRPKSCSRSRLLGGPVCRTERIVLSLGKSDFCGLNRAVAAVWRRFFLFCDTSRAGALLFSFCDTSRGRARIPPPWESISLKTPLYTASIAMEHASLYVSNSVCNIYRCPPHFCCVVLRFSHYLSVRTQFPTRTGADKELR